jgi:hypothetical protein
MFPKELERSFEGLKHCFKNFKVLSLEEITNNKMEFIS